MQNPSPRFRFFRHAAVAGALFTAALAGQAFAQCDEDQETQAGKAVAQAAAAKVAPAVAVTGKQMVDLSECTTAGGGVAVAFKYNFLGEGGLYWVQGSARVTGSAVSELKIRTMSPNLSAASTAKGVKLASN